jgi:hypothetical protein
MTGKKQPSDEPIKISTERRIKPGVASTESGRRRVSPPAPSSGPKRQIEPTAAKVPWEFPPAKQREGYGVYGESTFEQREHDRIERARIPGMSYQGQREINDRLKKVPSEMDTGTKRISPESPMASALAKLFREILDPTDQQTLAKSLTDGTKIERGTADAVLFLSSEAVHVLPREQWRIVISLLTPATPPNASKEKER